MALIVENGEIVAGANSYLSESDLRAFATARGVTLAPEDETGNIAVAVMAIKAMDYLNSLSYIGEMVEPGIQPLPWPRKHASVSLVEYIIPGNLKAAQAHLVLNVAAGVDLMPTMKAGAQFVKKQKLGPLEKEFSEEVYLASGNAPNIPAVDVLLKSLLAGDGFTLRTVRV